jgi:serine/threonine-protein kinase RsbW
MRTGPALIDGSPGRRFRPAGVSARDQNGSDRPCDVYLSVSAHAENVVLVRHVVGALAEAARLSPARVEDVRLAITEACTNVVRHAYPDGAGPLVVSATTGPDRTLTVVIRDDGAGIRPHPHPDGRGLGLPLMAATAQEFEIDRTRTCGTQVRMLFTAE